MKLIHGVKMKTSQMCPVCKKFIDGGQKIYNCHRKICNKCTFCGYENKLYRLLNHMKKCPKRGQKIPLDLTSPMKENTGILQEAGDPMDFSVDDPTSIPNEITGYIDGPNDSVPPSMSKLQAARETLGMSGRSGPAAKDTR